MRPTPHTLSPYWPKGLPADACAPATSLCENLAIAARRFPRKAAVLFFDTPISYERLARDVDAMAGFLQRRCGVARGDRVLLCSQSCPQFVAAYYAILRAGAVVVPVNAMSTADEIAYYAEDSGARVAFVARELHDRIAPLVLDHVIVHAYADAMERGTTLPVPDWVRQRLEPLPTGVATRWQDALAAALAPRAPEVGADDLCVLPYTSGTTGKPKGCVHTHATVMAAIWSSALWRNLTAETVFLGVAPMFHMLGMQNGMNLPLLLGATVIVAPRWDRDFAAQAIERYRVTAWTAPTAALVDFFANPGIDRYDLDSLTLVTGGGGPIPEGVAVALRERFGITTNEGYGMSETASFTLCNPLHRPKVQCLGMPTFGVHVRVIDPDTLSDLPAGEVGELAVSGPQVMLRYWNNEAGTAAAFFERDGRRYLRTGDLGRVDPDGYYFMTDRLKRMINVSGFKVWPAEIETRMYEHPAVLEACVIGVPDERQGESVKLFAILRPEQRGRIVEADIVAWARERMAAYKVPRIVNFVESLPRSSTGKILWRELH